MLELLRFSLTLIYAISLIYFFLGLELKHKKKLYIALGLTLMITIITTFVLSNFKQSTFVKLYPLFVHIPSFIVFYLISNCKGDKVLFVFLTVFVLSVPPVVLGNLISSLFSFNDTISSAIIMILYLPMWFIIYKYLRPLFLYMIKSTNKGWLEFSILPLSYYALIFFVLIFNSNNDKEIYKLIIILIGLVMTLGSYVIILRFFKQTNEQLILENNHNLLRTQISASQAHVAALKESQEKTFIYRHDMRHHLSLINSYLVENNKDAARKYISEIENLIENSIVKNYCSNYSVNLILSSYLEKAKQNNITIETEMNLPEIETIDNMDLCIVFANAIENAINACMLIPYPDPRTLKIISKIRNGQLFIEISNTYIKPVIFEDDIPVNMKAGHGIGTKSIVAIMEKYHGIYFFKAEKNLFTLRIVI